MSQRPQQSAGAKRKAAKPASEDRKDSDAAPASAKHPKVAASPSVVPAAARVDPAAVAFDAAMQRMHDAASEIAVLKQWLLKRGYTAEQLAPYSKTHLLQMYCMCEEAVEDHRPRLPNETPTHPEHDQLIGIAMVSQAHTCEYRCLEIAQQSLTTLASCLLPVLQAASLKWAEDPTDANWKAQVAATQASRQSEIDSGIPPKLRPLPPPPALKAKMEKLMDVSDMSAVVLHGAMNI